MFYQQVEVADAIEVYTTDDNDVEYKAAIANDVLFFKTTIYALLNQDKILILFILEVKMMLG